MRAKCHNEIPFYVRLADANKIFFTNCLRTWSSQILSLEQLVAGERVTMTLAWRDRETRADYGAQKT